MKNVKIQTVLALCVSAVVGCNDGGSEATESEDALISSAFYNSSADDSLVMAYDYGDMLLQILGDKNEDTGLVTDVYQETLEVDGYEVVFDVTDNGQIMTEGDSRLEFAKDPESGDYLFTFNELDSGEQLSITLTDEAIQEYVVANYQEGQSEANSVLSQVSTQSTLRDSTITSTQLPEDMTTNYPKQAILPQFGNSSNYLVVNVNQCGVPAVNDEQIFVKAYKHRVDYVNKDKEYIRETIPMNFEGNGIFKSKKKLSSLLATEYTATREEYYQSLEEKTLKECLKGGFGEAVDNASSDIQGILLSHFGVGALTDIGYTPKQAQIIYSQMTKQISSLQDFHPTDYAIVLEVLGKMLDDRIDDIKKDLTLGVIDEEKLGRKKAAVTRMMQMLAFSLTKNSAKCFVPDSVKAAMYAEVRDFAEKASSSYDLTVEIVHKNKKKTISSYVNNGTTDSLSYNIGGSPRIERVVVIPSFVREDQDYRVFVDTACFINGASSVQYSVRGTDGYSKSGTRSSQSFNYTVPGAERGVKDTNNVALYFNGNLVDSIEKDVFFK
ncbi:hypothetical protein [Vibrio harveyi]|uniref:hypothetical protein n=1 Tax=Vibrio harveyi TaxID=669 RepID=UPI003CE670E8